MGGYHLRSTYPIKQESNGVNIMCDKSEKQILRPSFKRRAIQLGLLLLVVCFLSPELTQPSVAQNGGKIRMLSFTVKTGDDDLRGGNDNLHVGIKLKHGSA